MTDVVGSGFRQPGREGGYAILVCAPVVDPACCATTLRRRAIDTVAEVVRHPGRAVLKTAIAACEGLHISKLREYSASPH